MKKFEQLKRQFQSLSGYLDPTDLSDKNISATTADFDRLFELSWKTLKAYLFQELGIYEAKTGSPREILKLAYAQELLYEGSVWLEMLKDRNDDAHIYHKADAVIYMSKIAGCYLPQVEKLIGQLSMLIPEEPWEDVQIPQDMLDFSFQQQKPLYQIVEEIRQEYHCQTDAEVYAGWKDYKKSYE